MKQTIELLAPAGSYEGLVAAVNAGADAVYIGGMKFGARAYADNPEADMLLAGIRYAHLHGSKVYMTINTLLKEKELRKELYDYLKVYYEGGLDAVIVQDLGVFRFIKKNFPDLPVHASTQMTVTGVEGARFLQESGASRVVLARELSLAEVKEICENVPVEIECFVHGAICFCYSGQCFFSSFLGGRSGNRGRCAQPCRLPYEALEEGKRLSGKNESYPLSLKDMTTIELLPELIEAGITSFKIEGRMKRPEYAAGVVEIYRKYLDLYRKNPKGFKVAREDKEKLLQLYSRSGNSEGYYKQHNGREMLTLENPAYRSGEEEMFQALREKYVKQLKKHKISGILRVYKGEPLKLDVILGDIQVHVEGGVVDAAMKQPMTMEKLEKQIKKTGGTVFEFENMEILMDSHVFVPLQAINELRRQALNELEVKLLQGYERKIEAAPMETPKTSKKNQIQNKKEIFPLHVSVETVEQLEEVSGCEGVQAIYVDASMYTVSEPSYVKELENIIKKVKQAEQEVYFYLPAIFRKKTYEVFEGLKEQLFSLGFDGMVVRNYETLMWLKKNNYQGKIISDFNVYTFNSEAKEFLTEEGVSETTYPLELNEYEMKELKEPGILTVYGHIPFMTTAQCINKTYSGCDKIGKKNISLKDRYKKNFYVTNYCDYCYNIIRNGVPLSLLGAKKSVENIQPSALRLMFTVESPKQCGRIVKAFGKLDSSQEEKLFSEFTRGHLKKGVE